MAAVARKDAPGLLIVGTLAGAALGYLMSELAAPQEATALTMGGATLGAFLAVLLDMLCSHYQVADVLPRGAQVGCLVVGVATLLLVTAPSIAAAWMSGLNSNLFHYAMAAEPHVVLLLVVTLSGAIGGALAAATSAAASATGSAGDRQRMTTTLILSLSGFTLGLLLCVVVRSVQFLLMVGFGAGAGLPALLFAWLTVLDRNTLGTLAVGYLAAVGCWTLAGPWWRKRPAAQRTKDVHRIRNAPTAAVEVEVAADHSPNDVARQQRKAAILARMSADAEIKRRSSSS
ncbi:MAG: hypothetical protein RIC55_18425 [Pirellulaceae bacterium]